MIRDNELIEELLEDIDVIFETRILIEKDDINIRFDLETFRHKIAVFLISGYMDDSGKEDCLALIFQVNRDSSGIRGIYEECLVIDESEEDNIYGAYDSRRWMKRSLEELEDKLLPIIRKQYRKMLEEGVI